MLGKILVVDDLAPNRELIREALDGSGYEISEAATASDALERLQHHETDLVITKDALTTDVGLSILS
ncbi:MAG: response regulator [Candidatus Sulfotelmatobacter sp.]|jgi:CheY-like chemotaxis protein